MSKQFTTLVTLAFAMTAPMSALASGTGPSADAPGQDRVCLITWANAADAASAADATAIDGKYLPRQAADQQAARSDGKSRVFDYSNRTESGNTGTYTITNNEEERAFCEGPEFNPDQR